MLALTRELEPQASAVLLTRKRTNRADVRVLVAVLKRKGVSNCGLLQRSESSWGLTACLFPNLKTG